MQAILSSTADTEPMSFWYMAQLKPNCWQMAERHLVQQGFRVFCPLEERILRRAQRLQRVRAPLFPGYLFLSFDPDDTQWRSINATRGVSRLVCFSPNEPAQVPEAVLTGLMLRCDMENCISAPRVAAGDTVRIVEGPFADFVATVDEIAPERRAWVLLEIMGQMSRVMLSPANLCPAHAVTDGR